MKNSELRATADGLMELSRACGAKTAYICIKNAKAMEAELKLLTESYRLPDSYQAYEKERIELCVQHSKKDENGNACKVALSNGVEKFDIEDDSKFKEELQTLQARHKDSLEEYGDSLVEFESLMDSETTLDLRKISIEDVPDNYKKEVTDPETGKVSYEEVSTGELVAKIMPMLEG